MGGLPPQAKRLPFAQEATSELVLLTLALGPAVGLLALLPGWVSGTILAVLTFIWGGSLFFFRDPPRAIRVDDTLYLSPADGKVLVAERAQAETAWRVAIFMGALDVHVNRAPAAGVVRWVRHQPGAHLQAFRAEAAVRNESNSIALDHGEARILIKQVAGIMARRIACSVRAGQRLEQGERLGIIKLGSRVELTLPGPIELLVTPGDKVQAGLSPIARKLQEPQE